jgi:hypothetical protein
MEIVAKKYRLTYDAPTAVVGCHGSLFLNGNKEYEPLLNLLKEAVDQQSEKLTFDLRGLEFLNSSGINTIMQFVTYVADTKPTHFEFIVLASESNLFHRKLSKNLQRLFASLQVKFE